MPVLQAFLIKSSRRPSGWRSKAAVLALGAAGCVTVPGSLHAQAEPISMTCSLLRTATAYEGTCDVPCLVNALAVDIDGPNPKVSCDAAPRRVAVMLKQAQEIGRAHV